MRYKEHQQEFKEKVASGKIEYFGTPQEAGFESTLKVGDKVTFTNEGGVRWEGHTILGFSRPWSRSNRCVYLDTDCYWVSKSIISLTIEK